MNKARRGTARPGNKKPTAAAPPPARSNIAKTPSGLSGFDEITFGGLPANRPTLVYGAAGCGKTLFAIQFLVRGAVDFGEPGVFLTFEESIDDLKLNARSLGHNLGDLTKRRLLTIEHAMIDPAREIGRGEYDLDALFMRLARAIDAIKAKRIVIDSLETLIRNDADRTALRQGAERLFRWLRNRGVTSIITAEEGVHGRTKQGFEEYIADCVIHLAHRVKDQVSTRTVRVVKYRGSAHGTNEYPFLIDESGIEVLPVTSIGLTHEVSNERVSTGIPRLDTMLGGKGFYRGTTVLLSGTPGSGKSTLSSHYVDAACKRGERVLVFTYEESPEQVMRNMASVGIHLKQWVDAGLLRFIAARPSMYGLEMHLAIMLRAVRDFEPRSVVIDPISNLVRAGGEMEAHAMVVRLIDALKTKGVTTVLTHPTADITTVDHTELAISSIIDTWILLQTLKSGGERNRTLYVLKSRGMDHSNQVREFIMTPQGVQLIDVYTGPEGVLTGSARVSREAADLAQAQKRAQEIERHRATLDRRRKAVTAQIAALQAELAADQDEAARAIEDAQAVESGLSRDRKTMADRRHADQG